MAVDTSFSLFCPWPLQAMHFGASMTDIDLRIEGKEGNLLFLLLLTRPILCAIDRPRGKKGGEQRSEQDKAMLYDEQSQPAGRG